MNKILNTFYGLINKEISVLYSPSSRFFDPIIYALDDINTYVHKDLVQNYYYDIFFSNNFLTHTNETKNFCLSNHIKDVIGFHSAPPSNFKKEDVALLHHNSTNIHKIIFGQDIAETWRFKPSDKVSIIEYGIPRPQVVCDSYENRNNILILNLENSQQIQMLYNNISASIPNVDIINSNNIPIENLDQMLLKYDLCIDFGNKINALYCISRGIKCITPLEIDSTNLIYKIYDYKNIIDIIKQVLSIKLDHNTRIKSAEEIIDQYNYETFKNKLITKLQQVKNEIFKP